MSSSKSGRILVAATLAAALFLAAPAQAIGGPGAPQGFLEQVVAWFVEIWLSAETPGTSGSTGQASHTDESQTPTPVEDEEDPAGCRSGDYTVCVDPNG